MKKLFGFIGVTLITFICILFITNGRIVTLPSEIKAHIQCLGPNNEVRHFGFAAFPQCVDTYTDGGKMCIEGSECLSGLCLITREKATYLEQNGFIDPMENPNSIIFSNKKLIKLPTESIGTCKKDSGGLCWECGIAIDKDENLIGFICCD